MFVSFTVENAYSFYDEQTLSARAVKTCKDRLEDATFKMFPEREDRLVKTIAIYGANASGKSNLFKALDDLRNLVLYSSYSTVDSHQDESVGIMPFLFAKDGQDRETRYTLEFIIEGYQYKYQVAAIFERIVGEFLVRKNFKGRKFKELFSRVAEKDGSKIVCKNDFEQADESLKSKTRNNALFLSTCAAFNVSEACKIADFFRYDLHVISAERLTSRRTSRALDAGKYREKIVQFMQMTDPGIADVSVDRASQETGRVLPNGEREIKVSFKPQVTPKMKDGSVMTELKVPLEAVSSLGTQKAYNLAADIFEVLETGTVLALDELDSRLHPLLTREIIKMFNSRELNPKNAQLIFNTHDTNLLSVKTYDSAKDKKTYLLRRDEIYFVEKNSVCSRVYSLIDFKKGGCRSVRKDASYEKDYLEGLYGAIPYLGGSLG